MTTRLTNALLIPWRTLCRRRGVRCPSTARPRPILFLVHSEGPSSVLAELSSPSVSSILNLHFEMCLHQWASYRTNWSKNKLRSGNRRKYSKAFKRWQKKYTKLRGPTPHRAESSQEIFVCHLTHKTKIRWWKKFCTSKFRNRKVMFTMEESLRILPTFSKETYIHVSSWRVTINSFSLSQGTLNGSMISS